MGNVKKKRINPIGQWNCFKNNERSSIYYIDSRPPKSCASMLTGTRIVVYEIVSLYSLRFHERNRLGDS